MSRFIAFLRSINVGGHTVKMDHLRGLFESIGFSGVETFIASGNVIFDSSLRGQTSSSRSAPALAKKIEDRLREALGYEVATFIRSATELTEIASYNPFKGMEDGDGLYIAFVSEPPGDEVRKKLMALRTETDDFHIYKREIYWLCRTKFSDSAFSGPRLEKVLGTPATIRNSTTVRKMAAKFGQS